MKVAEHGDTLVNRRPHGAKSFSGVPDPQLIVIGRDAVLRHKQGHASGHLPGPPKAHAQCLRPYGPSGQRRRLSVGDGLRPLRPDDPTGVRLHPEKVIRSGWFEELILPKSVPFLEHTLRPRAAYESLSGHRPANVGPDALLQNLAGSIMGRHHGFRRLLIGGNPGEIGYTPKLSVRRNSPNERGHDIRLIDGDHPSDVPEDRCGRFDVTTKDINSAILGPAPRPSKPARTGEMVECDDRLDLTLQTPIDHSSVVVELCSRYPTLFWLDSSPLDAKPISVEAQVSDQVEVLRPPVIAVAGVSARLRKQATTLKLPEIARNVVSLNLVSGRGRPPEKPW